MIVSIFFCVLAVLLCLLDRNKPNRKFGGLEMAFLTLMCFLSIRYGFGNDYEGYLNNFKDFTSYSYGLTEFDKWASLQARGEYGFVILNKLFQPVGFFGFIIFLSFFSLWALYRLIKAYVPINWYWFAVFILAFNPSFLIVGIAGAIRQWIVVTIFVFAFDFIKKKKIVFAIMIMIVSSTIHKTALAIIPFCLMPLLGLNKFSKKKSIILSLFIVLWFVLIPQVGYTLFLPLFESESMEYYTGYMAEDTGLSIFGISSLIVIGIPFLCLSLIKRMNYDMKLMCLIMMCSLLFIPMVTVNACIGRLAWYFSIFTVVVYPKTMELLQYERKCAMVRIIVCGLVVYYVYLFIRHFLDPIWYDTSYHFHTIFEQPWQ
jgi:hypothetical protein